MNQAEKGKLEKFITHFSDEVMRKGCVAVEYALGFDHYFLDDSE